MNLPCKGGVFGAALVDALKYVRKMIYSKQFASKLTLKIITLFGVCYI